MKLVSVILNYNDAARTIAQVKRICAYACMSAVVVVDNASSDDSFAQLAALTAQETQGKLRLVRAEQNRGYGAGNNLGVRYAAEQLGAAYVLIANPDTCFTEDCVQALLAFAEAHEAVGIVSAQMHDSQHGLQQTAWPLRSWFWELVNSGPLSRRLFRACINYPARYFRDRKAVQVDVVHGSMLLVKTEAFLASGGYDESVFLYAEENILAQRMRRTGYRSALLLTQQYEHENSGSISRTYKSIVPKQKLRQASELYYYEHYLGIGKGKRLLTGLFHRIVLLETAVAEKLHRL